MRKYGLYITIVILVSCQYKNPPERNKLIFKTSSNVMYDSLKEMSLILASLPERQDGLNRNYVFKGEKKSLYVNGKETVDTSLSQVFSQHIVPRFWANAIFLQNNGIDGAYFSREDNDWIFLYHYSTNDSFDDARSVRIKLPNSLKKDYSTQQILDSMYGIYLMAPQEAHIR